MKIKEKKLAMILPGMAGGVFSLQINVRDFDKNGFVKKVPQADWVGKWKDHLTQDEVSLSLSLMTNPSPGDFYYEGEIAVAPKGGGGAGGKLVMHPSGCGALGSSLPLRKGEPLCVRCEGSSPDRAEFPHDYGMTACLFWTGKAGTLRGMWWAKWNTPQP